MTLPSFLPAKLAWVMTFFNVEIVTIFLSLLWIILSGLNRPFNHVLDYFLSYYIAYLNSGLIEIN